MKQSSKHNAVVVVWPAYVQENSLNKFSQFPTHTTMFGALIFERFWLVGGKMSAFCMQRRGWSIQHLNNMIPFITNHK